MDIGFCYWNIDTQFRLWIPDDFDGDFINMNGDSALLSRDEWIPDLRPMVIGEWLWSTDGDKPNAVLNLGPKGVCQFFTFDFYKVEA